MQRFLIFTLAISLLAVSCSVEPTPTPDLVATQIAVEMAAHATMTAQAPTPVPSPASAIVGRWALLDQPATRVYLEFFSEGSLAWKSDEGIQMSNYRFLDETRIRLEGSITTAFGSLAEVKQLDGDTLVLSGENDYSGAFDMPFRRVPSE